MASSLFDHGDGFGSVLTECPICKGLGEVVVKSQDYHAWRRGTLAQDAFPYVRAAFREQIISGTHPTCWRETFGAAPWETWRDRVAYRVEPFRYRVRLMAWRVASRFGKK